MRKNMMTIFCLLISINLSGLSQIEDSNTTDYNPIVINYYMWDDPTYTQIVDEFNSSQREIFVNTQVIPALDYEVKLLTILAGGADIDAYMQKRPTDLFPQYSNGYIEPLDSLILKFDHDLDEVLSSNSTIKVDGKILGIPFRRATWYTYYNKVLFKKAGVELPNTYIEDGDWTWKKFGEVAHKISSLGDDIFGGFFYTWGCCQVVPALQDGVEFTTNEGEIVLKDSVLESFKLRRSLENDLAIMPLVDLKISKTHYSSAFFGGKVGMLIIGEWFPGQLITAQKEGKLEGFSWNDWGVTRLPSDTPVYSTFGNTTFNHVHANSKKKEAAFKFIRWMGGDEGAVAVAHAGFLPTRMNSRVEEALRAILPDEESFKYFTESPKVYPQFYSKYGSRVEQVINKMMEKYLFDEFDSDAEFMNEFISDLEDIISTTN